LRWTGERTGSSMVVLWATTIGAAVWSPPRALGVINECWLQRKSTEHIELSATGARVNLLLTPVFSRWSKGTTVNLLLTPGFTGHDKEECRKRYLELWVWFLRTSHSGQSRVCCVGVGSFCPDDVGLQHHQKLKLLDDQVQGRGSTTRTDLVQVI